MLAAPTGYDEDYVYAMDLQAAPTVLRIGGLRVVIWPNDHRPAHIHVKGAGGEAVFNLNCPGGPPALRESYGFRLADLDRIEEVLAAAITGLGLHWPRLDADLYVPALLHGVFGSKNWMARQLGAEGGRARTLAKAAASRENGRKGGRPKKAATA
jgi:hypothetical protein